MTFDFHAFKRSTAAVFALLRSSFCIALCLMFLGSMILPADAVGDSQPTPKRKPNIVLIMTDDQNYASLQFMPKTLQRFSRNSIDFTNAFVTTPNCCPARAGFLSGLYNYAHGVLANGGPHGGAPAYASPVDVAQSLSENGYRTGLFGKWMTNFDPDTLPKPKGFEEWLTFDDGYPKRSGSKVDHASFNYLNWHGVSNKGYTDFADGPQDYSTDVLARSAIRFLKSSDPRPFFLQFSPYAPHLPAVPAQRHADIDPATVVVPKSPSYGKVVENGRWGERLSEQHWQRREPGVESRARKQIVSLFAVDDAVDALFARLEETGQINNTIVVFTSDNGFAWGDHRWSHKLCPYDECLRVPLLVYVPDGMLSGSIETAKNNQLVTNLDLARTLFELGAPGDASKAKEGSSLVPTILDASVKVRDDLAIEMYGTGGQMPKGLIPWQGLRTTQRKYVRFADGQEELFDLVNDPHELVNVADETRYSEELAAFAKRVDEVLQLGVARRTVKLTRTTQCPVSTHRMTYTLEDAVNGTASSRLINVMIRVPFDRSVRINDRNEFRIVVRAKNERGFAIRSSKLEILRVHDKTSFAYTFPASLHAIFSTPGSSLSVVYPDSAVLDVLCEHPPEIFYDVVSGGG